MRKSIYCLKTIELTGLSKNILFVMPFYILIKIYIKNQIQN